MWENEAQSVWAELVRPGSECDTLVQAYAVQSTPLDGFPFATLSN